jgi:hypothetical protein
MLFPRPLSLSYSVEQAPYLFYFLPPGGYIFFVYLLGSYSREDTGGDSVSLRILGAIALHLKLKIYFVHTNLH